MVMVVALSFAATKCRGSPATAERNLNWMMIGPPASVSCHDMHK